MSKININLIRLMVPDARSFHGSIILFKDNRYICIYHNSEQHGLASCFLDLIDGVYHVVDHSCQSLGEHGIVDTRIVKFNQEYYISNTDSTKYPQTINLRKLSIIDNKIIINPNFLLNFPPINNFPDYQLSNEKNWCPMELDNKFYYIYSLNPHRILEVDVHGTGQATLEYETSWTCDLSWWEQESWVMPKYRLNTPPIKLPDGTYLSMFHTMKIGSLHTNWHKITPNNLRCYWTGFYQFQGHAPFKVLKISAYPLIESDFELPSDWPFHPPPSGGNPFYPFSLFLDGDNLIINGGSNEIAIAYCVVNLEKVLQSLEDVQTS